jgi:hypothetical protein
MDSRFRGNDIVLMKGYDYVFDLRMQCRQKEGKKESQS